MHLQLSKISYINLENISWFDDNSKPAFHYNLFKTVEKTLLHGVRIITTILRKLD